MLLKELLLNQIFAHCNVKVVRISAVLYGTAVYSQYTVDYKNAYTALYRRPLKSLTLLCRCALWVTQVS